MWLHITLPRVPLHHTLTVRLPAATDLLVDLLPPSLLTQHTTVCLSAPCCLFLSPCVGCAAWLCMAGLANSVATAIACITVAAAATAFSDVVADSIVVQLARESPGATEGALQSM